MVTLEEKSQQSIQQLPGKKKKKKKEQNSSKSTVNIKCIGRTEGDDCMSLFVQVQLSLSVHDKYKKGNSWKGTFAIWPNSTLVKTL